MNGIKRFRKLAGAGLAFALVAGTVVPVQNVTTVYAEEETGQSIDMSTSYPGITMKAGENASFNLNFSSSSGNGCDADLSIEEIPDGWEGYFSGNGSEISRVHIAGAGIGDSTDSGSTATFTLTVPDDAEEGTYEIKLKADAGSQGSDELELKVIINETEAGQSSFTTEYPEQQGASGTAFSFDAVLTNSRGTAETYSLSADAPTGWTVSFTPSSESSQVASVPVEAGASENITIAVTPPETITEGEYTIPCTASSSSDTLTTELKVTITGSYKVELTTPTGNLSFDAYSNVKKSVTLKINNTGNVDLENLQLSASSTPSDWEVTFSEDTIDTLAAGETKEITAYVTPSEDAVTGDYVTTLKVSNDETQSEAQFRVSVKVRTTWGIAAVAIIAALAAGLYFVFKKYGRR